MPSARPAEPSVADLFARLIDDAANLVRAELNLYRQTAYRRAIRARAGVIALAAGTAILMAGLVALMMGIVLALASLIGPLGAGLAVALVAGIAGYLLIRSGVNHVIATALDADEKDHESIVERVL